LTLLLEVDILMYQMGTEHFRCLVKNEALLQAMIVTMYTDEINGKITHYVIYITRLISYALIILSTQYLTYAQNMYLTH
jgi:hypothetical protein